MVSGPKNQAVDPRLFVRPLRRRIIASNRLRVSLRGADRRAADIQDRLQYRWCGCPLRNVPPQAGHMRSRLICGEGKAQAQLQCFCRSVCAMNPAPHRMQVMCRLWRSIECEAAFWHLSPQ